MNIVEYKGKKPIIGENVFIAPGSFVIGDVKVANGVNIWFNAVIRADINDIIIGENTNVQDNATLHVDYPPHNLVIGNNVTIGHNAVLHACTIGDNSLIGMGAIVLSRSVIGPNCVIGAGALVLEGQNIPEGSLVVGAPAKIIRVLTEDEILLIRDSAEHYMEIAREYL